MKRLALPLAAVLLLAGVSPTLADDTAPAPSSSHPGKGERRHELLERWRGRGLPVPSGSVLALPSGLPPALTPSPSASAASLVFDRAQLTRRLRELAESRAERRERSRSALLDRWGKRLSEPQVKAELTLHATRVAELQRARLLAESTRTGAAREKLLQRIDRLLALEQARHRKALATPAPHPAPSASAGVPR